MTRQQRAAHERMLRALPVRTHEAKAPVDARGHVYSTIVRRSGRGRPFKMHP